MVAVADVIDVLLVDDDALVRSGLSMILQSDSSIRVVGEAADGAGGVDAARRLEPDVVLMDIRMPVMDGLAATELLRTGTGGPAILVLTTFDTDEYLLRALRLGANGFLLKDTPPRDIIEAVKRVRDGESMLSPSAVGTLVSAWREQDRRAAGVDDVLDVLTDREREVAIAVAQGLSNAEISGTLFMSVATVKTYVSRVLAKLGCTNRVQIAIAVFESR
ncbi:response regulator [Rhodococcoides fascians]|jgi:DNA-binding NarL/FixJ family response regulator|uniref:response regulator n=1 Tax=Rhodococcoides fascians TaxID=1828 RepID=UPI000562AE62|nr:MULTISPECIES: response regulator transcription factor [Rhodococcus]OZF06452.1 DNA-binding response regulator [Rhodococcus sp. 15-1189-1-1a]OZF22267.1 DNA-binding response regulator [Rhodococcus sp. 14-2686-1-2]